MEDPAADLASNKGISIFACLAASLIEFGSAANLCHDAEPNSTCHHSGNAWAIACGVLAAVFCIIRLVLLRVQPELPAHADMAISCILVTLWVFGAAFNTRADGTFNSADNGYFSTWIALSSAVAYAYFSFVPLQEKIKSEVANQNSGLVICMLASLVLMCTAADHCHKVNCHKKNAYAVAVGVISVVFTFVLLLLLRFNRCPPMLSKIMALFLVALWATGAAVNTSKGKGTNPGPFSDTCSQANGYFSSWIAFFSAIYFAYYCWFPKESDTYEQPAEVPADDGPKYQPIS